MRKLVIAVLLFSFLGYGPLKSVFHQDTTPPGTPITQTIKESTGLFQDGKRARNFLITEETSPQSIKDTAILLLYDSSNDRLMVGNVTIPKLGKQKGLDIIKKSVEKNYNMKIDHIFSFNYSGIAHMIDLLAPNGIPIILDKEKKIVNGEQVILLLEKYSGSPKNQSELKEILSSVKNEIKKSQTAETLLTTGPALLNEAFKNVDTDLNKGELLSLGFSALMNPVTTIEPIKLKETGQSVNSQIDQGNTPLLY